MSALANQKSIIEKGVRRFVYDLEHSSPRDRNRDQPPQSSTNLTSSCRVDRRAPELSHLLTGGVANYLALAAILCYSARLQQNLSVAVITAKLNRISYNINNTLYNSKDCCAEAVLLQRTHSPHGYSTLCSSIFF